MTGLLLPPLLMLLAALVPGESANTDAPPGERGCGSLGAPVGAASAASDAGARRERQNGQAVARRPALPVYGRWPSPARR